MHHFLNRFVLLKNWREPIIHGTQCNIGQYSQGHGGDEFQRSKGTPLSLLPSDFIFSGLLKCVVFCDYTIIHKWKSAWSHGFSHTIFLILSLHDPAPLIPPKSVSRSSLRSTNCNLRRSHSMKTLRITYGGPERGKERSLGEREEGGRSSELTRKLVIVICMWPQVEYPVLLFLRVI